MTVQLAPTTYTMYDQGNGTWKTSPLPTGGTLIGRADWSLHALTPTSILTGTSWSTWTTVNATQSVVSNAVQMNYPNSVANEGTSANVAFYITDQAIIVDDVYIQFEARMPNLKGGLKFLKLFGRNDGTYANATLAADYAGYEIGGFPYIGFGDGATTTNDTQNLIWTKNQTQNALGARNSGATIVTPQANWFTGADWGTGWHTFKFRMKYNSGTTAGNEVADGIFYLEIDGNVYVNATNIFNRHYSNPRAFDNIGLGGWSQSINFAWDVWFRNVKISTGGWVS